MKKNHQVEYYVAKGRGHGDLGDELWPVYDSAIRDNILDVYK